jgi:hypothetical protein
MGRMGGILDMLITMGGGMSRGMWGSPFQGVGGSPVQVAGMTDVMQEAQEVMQRYG